MKKSTFISDVEGMGFKCRFYDDSSCLVWDPTNKEKPEDIIPLLVDLLPAKVKINIYTDRRGERSVDISFL